MITAEIVSNFRSPHEDVLVTFLVDVELQAMAGPTARTPLPIGIQRIKSDPDMDISSLFSNRFAYEQEAYEVRITPMVGSAGSSISPVHKDPIIRSLICLSVLASAQN